MRPQRSLIHFAKFRSSSSCISKTNIDSGNLKRSSMRFKKIILVGSEIRPALMELLLDYGSRVTKLPNGKMAVSHAQRELFDAAIIVSTGEEMDLAETVFNLRDINSSMQVIIVSDSGGCQRRRDSEAGSRALRSERKGHDYERIKKAFGLIGWMLGDRGCLRAIS